MDRTTYIRTLYKDHPLQAVSILERAEISAAKLNRTIEEQDLAVDYNLELTDQNHIGGLAATLRLARLAGIARRDRVLDAGCGLGGPARVLASKYGCRVLGVDINVERIADAELLTRKVQLSSLVKFECRDLKLQPIVGKFDVVWGQNSWLHLGIPEEVVPMLATPLVTGGRLALEEVCLLREARGSELGKLAELCEIWGCALYFADSWRKAVGEACGKRPRAYLTLALLRSHLSRLESVSRRKGTVWSRREAQGIVIARDLVKRGVMGYFRLVAVKVL